jgi:hypothetical protein
MAGYPSTLHPPVCHQSRAPTSASTKPLRVEDEVETNISAFADALSLRPVTGLAAVCAFTSAQSVEGFQWRGSQE